MAPTCAMDIADPFAAFLAARPKAVDRAGKASPVRKVPQALGQNLDSTASPDLEVNPFASYMAFRPVHEPRTVAEQGLREELLRTKRQLLEVAVKAELQALDTETPAEAAARLRQLKVAQRYLRHPERALEAHSDASDSEAEVAQRGRPQALTSMASNISPASSYTRSPTGRRSITAVSVRLPEELPAQRETTLRHGGLAASAPDLGSHKVLTPGSTRRCNLSTLPLICGSRGGSPRSRPTSSRASSKGSAAPDDYLLEGWWSKTRCWNIMVSKMDCLARRRTLGMPGGCVIFGDGRIPTYAGTHLLAPGHYYAMRIDGIDDEHFPLDKLKGMSIGFGVSRLPPYHQACERRAYAYEIPGTVLVGYGARLIEGGQWSEVPWDPRVLKLRDIVGVLVAPDGDLVIYVNGRQVLRVQTSLADDAVRRGKSGPRRFLYPVVDLHGRISAVTLLPRTAPPNLPLRHRNRARALGGTSAGRDG